MLAVRITYWSVGGKFRRRRGKVTGELPRHLINGGDRQAHSLMEHPIYTQSVDPFYLQVPTQRLRWLDLTGNRHWDPGSLSMETELVSPVPVPPPPPKAEGLGVLIEEGAVYPVSCLPFSDEIARQKDQADTHAEAYALARAREAKAAGGDGLTRAAYVGLLIGALILVGVVAAVSLQARFGGQDPVPVASAATSVVTARW